MLLHSDITYKRNGKSRMTGLQQMVLPGTERIQTGEEPNPSHIFSKNMSLEIRVIPFEPFAWVAGERTGKREDKLAQRIRQEIPLNTFTEFLKDRVDRLVALRVQFFLWEGSS